MKILIDVNVMLDFLQRREPFFENAASVLDAIMYERVQGVLPAHGITILSYFLSRGANRETAMETLEWLLNIFEISACDKELLVRALGLKMDDFEDAVVAASASSTRCDYIVTRNLAHFVDSPVRAIAPEAFLQVLDCN